MRSALIRVSGVVQGVGFRPFVHRMASKWGLRGYVKNMGGSEVEILVEGREDQIANFLSSLFTEKPPPAKIEELSLREVPPSGSIEFSILPSDSSPKLPSMIPPDIAICEGCLAEIHDPRDRRYRYALNSCAWCGPRFSMMERPPYDRENTSMADFPLCDDCLSEYGDPGNVRRFHAQGMSCPVCGPRLWLEEPSGLRVDCDDPISEAASLIREGEIVAIKGIGGYHVAALATDDGVVEELRRRKDRPQKPFALMALDLVTVERFAEIPSREIRSLLAGPERPIVLLPERPGSGLSRLVAPGLNAVGFMLPYTGVHHLLLEEVPDGVLIMTSGNERGRPMCIDEECARRRLSGIVDHILQHNRRIVNRVDDSVVRLTAGRVTFLRRSRGYAPSWIRLPFRLERPVIAFGAELQNAGAVAFEDKLIPTQFVGDTDEYENLTYLERALEFLVRSYRLDLSEAVLAADMHPSYSSRRLAELWSMERGMELVLVQHHHAHAVSVAAELGVDGDWVGVAVAADGLGYGLDGTLWGGEVLKFSYRGAERFASLTPVPMPGGDAATRRPPRMLIGVLSTFMGDDEVKEILRSRGIVDHLPGGEGEVDIALAQARSGAPMISSVGRVMDAAASLLGVCHVRTYEGEPAMKLEAAAAAADPLEYSLVRRDGIVRVDLRRTFESLIERREDGVPALAGAFISSLGEALGSAAAEAADSLGEDLVVASGGAAVNTLFISAMERALSESGIRLVLNSKLPPGDGGVAAGQAVSAGLGVPSYERPRATPPQ